MNSVPVGLHIGGYVSKRKRERLTEQKSPENAATSERVKEYLGRASLRGRERGVEGEEGIYAKQGRVGNRASRAAVFSLTEHSKPVLSLDWHPTDPLLLLSSSLDGTVRLWDASPQGRGRACVASWSSLHSGSIWDAVWVTRNTILTGGADNLARYTDIETGQAKLTLQHRGIVTAIRCLPEGENSVITGDSNAHIQRWDLRVEGKRPVAEYLGAGGKILDIAFLRRGAEFVASSSIVRRNAANQALSVWDVKSTVTLSNQIYTEPYTCPCLRVHPMDATFLAQSNGNYIGIFSSNKPYRLNKYKRFEGHTVEGFAVGFDISSDGSLVCSASASGETRFYDYHSAKLMRSVKVSEAVCLSVAWHPLLPSTTAVSDWDGAVHILQ